MSKANRLHIGFILAFCGILVVQLSISQTNYKPGYIITNNGDTIHGSIDYSNWDRNPEGIIFKDLPSAQIARYSYNDIKLFSVKGRIYTSAIVEKEVSIIETMAMQFDPELQIEEDTVFLQIIIQGKKSLYRYKDRDGKDNFYIRDDGKYSLLYYKIYYKKIEGLAKVMTNNKFIGQLTLYLNDCHVIKSEIDRTKYSRSSLEDLFLSYYNYTNSEIEFKNVKRRPTTELGFMGGLSISSIEFSGEGYPYITDIEYDKSYNASLGFFYDIIFPGAKKMLSFNNELMLTSYDCKGKYLVYEDSYKSTVIYTEFAYFNIKMNNMFRFKVPIKEWAVYLNGGLASGLNIGLKNERTVESRFGSVTNSVQDKCLYETRDIELGYVIGFGVKYKRFSLEGRYEKGNGMSDLSEIKSTTQRYHALFGYRIK